MNFIKNIKSRSFLSISIVFFTVGCTAPKYPVNKIPKNKTYVKDEKNSLNKHHSFKKDRVPNFDYNNLGYYSDEGAYFGYFDQRGYYLDDSYYGYDRRLTYQDRQHRQGSFAPNVKHFRSYREDDGGGSYYYVPTRRYAPVRPHHPVHMEERNLGSGSYSGVTYQRPEDRVIRD